MCCNLGCWHCPHVESAAGVVFHELRRVRVRERDIFRFGTGIFTPLNLLFDHRTVVLAIGGNYCRKGQNWEIGLFSLLPFKPWEVFKGRPANVVLLMGMVLGQIRHSQTAIRAETFAIWAAERIDG